MIQKQVLLAVCRGTCFSLKELPRLLKTFNKQMGLGF